MGLFDLVANTIEGVTEATVNTAKATVGVATLPFDDGKTMDEGLDGIEKGVEKIGDSEKRD